MAVRAQGNEDGEGGGRRECYTRDLPGEAVVFSLGEQGSLGSIVCFVRVHVGFVVGERTA